jgi:hypothetical protein
MLTSLRGVKRRSNPGAKGEIFRVVPGLLSLRFSLGRNDDKTLIDKCIFLNNHSVLFIAPHF